jgi:DNA-binding SARP family transcriptional activator
MNGADRCWTTCASSPSSTRSPPRWWKTKWQSTPRAEAEIACGRPGAIIGELEALTAEHPYHEPLWAQLITAYYVTERQSDALRAYRRLKTGLAEGLGIDPGPTVSALHERILRQAPGSGALTTTTSFSTTTMSAATTPSSPTPEPAL